MTDQSKKRAYRAYAGMKARCYSPKCAQFKNYGARGISMSPRWLESFQNFYDDMGAPPDGMSLDRIDNDAGYSKENCRWATSKEQRNNQRRSQIVELDGETMCLYDWAKRGGMNYMTLKARLAKGMTLRAALDKPINQNQSAGGYRGAMSRWESSAMASSPAAGKGDL